MIDDGRVVVRCTCCSAIRPADERDPGELEALDDEELGMASSPEPGGITALYVGHCRGCALLLGASGLFGLWAQQDGIHGIN